MSTTALLFGKGDLMHTKSLLLGSVFLGTLAVAAGDARSTELYAGVRVYDVEQAAPILVAGTNFLAAPSADPNATVAVMTGARII